MCDDGADQIIRWSTADAVVGVAAVAAVASYEHAYALVRAHGESGWMARLVPFTLDGLIYASSMVMPGSARINMPAAMLALSAGSGSTRSAADTEARMTASLSMSSRSAHRRPQ